MKTFVFDIDGTICTNTEGCYEEAVPYKERINYVNSLYEEGNKIKYFTARGSTTGIDWDSFTRDQLKSWGALYHELILGKPHGDIFIDDKAFNCNYWEFPTIKENRKSSENEKSFLFKKPILNHLEVLNKILTDNNISNQINKICRLIVNSFENGGKVMFAGNGGSFSDSLHLAAEFVCKFKHNRDPLPALTLGANPSTITAIGNDYNFTQIFSRELISIGKKNDVLIVLSTSGNSQNIVSLFEEAKILGIDCFALTGQTGGELSIYGDKIIRVPSKNTAIIQQVHIMLGHIICENTELDYI